MSNFTVSAASLRDARPFTSTQESRPILNGILIESTGTIVATDGHTMLVQAGGTADAETAPARDVIIRLDKAIPKWAEFVHIEIPDSPAANCADVPLVLKVTSGKGKVDYITAAEVAGPFPNWRQVLPRTASATAPLPPVNPALLDRFAIEGCGAIRMFADDNPSRPVRVAFDGRPKCIGILMPMASNTWTAGNVPELPATDRPPVPVAAAA